MTLEKKQSIIKLLERLDLAKRGWVILDNWDADLCAIGIAKRDCPRRRVYISTYRKRKGHYYFDCEQPRGRSKYSYDVVASGEDVTFDALLAAMTRHLDGKTREADVFNKAVTVARKRKGSGQMKLKCWKEYTTEVDRTRPARIKWWNDARYGMFVHFGTYSLLGRHEWAQGFEAIPAAEYEKLADDFKPRKGAPRAWARLARDAGMRYMVLTTKHHEGYCLWDTEQTDYNAVKRGPGRDLVAEYVDACREFGLKVGFYYSLMDWHHPDGARSAFDPEARRRFLKFTHGCVRELMSNYGKIDILWYDISRPFVHPEGWDSLALNQMARSLQPHILINDRAQLAEDFSTPEGSVTAEGEGRGWEACMTFNHTSWGYMPSAAPETHTARDILNMLNTACSGQGNLLLNIGPAPDGSVPPEAVTPLKTVGKWLERNGDAVYGKLGRAQWTGSGCGNFSTRGNKVYFWCRCWAGTEIGLGGFMTKLRSARFLDGGKAIRFEQKGPRIVLKNLPARCPDKFAGVAVIELEFTSKPKHLWCASLDVFRTKSQPGYW